MNIRETEALLDARSQAAALAGDFAAIWWLEDGSATRAFLLEAALKRFEILAGHVETLRLYNTMRNRAEQSKAPGDA